MTREQARKLLGGYATGTLTAEEREALFTAALDEFRSRYLLAYEPQGVRRDDGWHPLEVKLKDPAKGTVTARKGYMAGQ